MKLLKRYQEVRQYTEWLCNALLPEDYAVQAAAYINPPKWHLAHTTWFFETFILQAHKPHYKIYDPIADYLFNSHYEGVGNRIPQAERGHITRPSVQQVYDYRAYVDKHMRELLQQERPKLAHLLELGLQHEQRHQEFLLADIKYIFGKSTQFPPYRKSLLTAHLPAEPAEWIPIEAGVYEIGFEGEGFCFDHEKARHKVYLPNFQICSQLVKAEDFLSFMEDGGYMNYEYWLAEGWDWVQREEIRSPLYWHKQAGEWQKYTLGGLKALHPQEAVAHLSYYEADAFANWAGKRLPTEAEWEIASQHFPHGLLWEWTRSAYLPYPGYQKPEGILGEYNSKFMINQMVLRGGSVASSPGHIRPTYRNFFQPDKRWQFTGIRLVKDA